MTFYDTDEGHYANLSRSASRQRETNAKDLTKRALAGDTKARRMLEAEEVIATAREVTTQLRQRAEQGDELAIQKLRDIAAGNASTAPAIRSPNPSSANAGIAVDAAIRRERDRIATVFASSASIGRERGCANILTMDKGWSAAQIVANLPHLPTDRELAANAKRETFSASDAVWDRANAAVGRSATEASQAMSQSTSASASSNRTKTNADSVWHRANATVGRSKPATSDDRPNTSSNTSNAGRAKADSVWDRANAAIGRVKKETAR